MAKKELTYRGKTLEELQALSIKEVSQLLPSRARRSINRGLSDEKRNLLYKISVKGKAKTHRRDMIILPEMVGKVVQIYTGKEFVTVTIPFEAIGGYLGELALTRKRCSHSAPGVGASRSSKNISVK